MPGVRFVADTTPEARHGLSQGELCGFTQDEINESLRILARNEVVLENPELTDEADERSDLLVAESQIIRAPFHHIRRALEKQDLRVVAVDGWRTRGRPGLFDPRGVMEHHTASSIHSGNAPALGICVKGRPDLEGPLCNFLVGRNGTIFIVAAGRCNHAGEGGPYNGIPKDSGNAYLLGVECENNGIGEPWPNEQRRSMAILDAVLLNKMGETTKLLPGHKEWTDRKIDPHGIAMGPFRRRVRKEQRQLAA